MIKIILIIGLILAGIIVNAGGSPSGEYIGFRYWKDPGPFNEYIFPGAKGRFLGFWSTLIAAAYAFCNIQVTALTGAETKNPRKLIPEAMKMTFWRIIVFYVISIFIVGLLVCVRRSLFLRTHLLTVIGPTTTPTWATRAALRSRVRLS